MPTSQTVAALSELPLICRCTKGETGWTLDPETGVWVHHVCRKPSLATLRALALKTLL